jgi:hypothetical protein
MPESVSIKDTTNELLIKYDESFNKNYNKNLFIDSTIMNKEEILNKINDEIFNKDMTILILQYTALFVFLIGVIFIAYGFKKINLKNFIIISVILFIIYLLVITFKVYYSISIENTEKNIRNLSVQMATYIDSSIDKNNPYRCPAKCDKKSSTYSTSPVLTNRIDSPTLNIDPQTNIWENGDVPSDLYISPYNADSTRNPKPFFEKTFPRSTYYKCEWLGGDNQSLPNIETTFSSIPCNYRQNYEEKGRYICINDPNTISTSASDYTSQFNTMCDDVSVNKI